jgi:hypothetical protein
LGIVDSGVGNGNGSGNVFLSSSKFHLFTCFFMVLKRVLHELSDSGFITLKLVARRFWIQVRACEVEGDAVGAVEALRACIDVFEKIELEEGSGNDDIMIHIPHW